MARTALWAIAGVSATPSLDPPTALMDFGACKQTDKSSNLSKTDQPRSRISDMTSTAGPMDT